LAWRRLPEPRVILEAGGDGVVCLSGAECGFEGADPRLEFAGLKEPGRCTGGADEDSCPADRVVKAEGVGDGDIEHSPYAGYGIEALQVAGDDDRLLAPAAQATYPAGISGLAGRGRIVEEAEAAIDHRGGLA
jgi:hypothetical protein